MERIKYVGKGDDPTEFVRGRVLTGGRPEEISGKHVSISCLMVAGRPNTVVAIERRR